MPVLITGAGPTGLTLACELARRDVPFRLIDRAGEPAKGSRGKGLQPRTLEVFDDLGIVEKTLDGGVMHLPHRNYRGNQVIRDEDPAYDVVATPDVPYESALHIPQWRVEAILRERLEELGGRVEWNTELVGFESDEDGVSVSLANGDQLRVGYLAGCDGGSSMVRKGARIGFHGESLSEFAVLIADVEVTGLAPDRWHMWMDPERGFLGLSPFAAWTYWQMQVRIAPDAQGGFPAPTVDTLRRYVDSFTDGMPIGISEPAWTSVYRPNVRMVDAMRTGRIVLAGDAAHVHTPAGGLGLNTGVQDAYCLGWKLANAVRAGDPAAERLLDGYEAERLPIAEWLLDTSSERGRAFSASLRIGGKAGLATQSPETRQLGIGYRWSPLVSQPSTWDGQLHAGDRAPDAPCVTADGHPRRLFDVFRGPHMTLLGFGSQTISSLQRLRHPAVRTCLVSAVNDVPDGIDEHLVDKAGHANNAYAPTEPILIVVRPDGYIGLIAWSGDTTAVTRYLDLLAA